jgi:hypothetical protein
MRYIYGIWIIFPFLVFGQNNSDNLENYLINNPIWINDDNVWIKEEDKDLHSYSSIGCIINFYSNYTFFFTGNPLIKLDGTDSIAIDVTGWNDYIGIWKVDNNKILLNYRLIDREIRVPGDKVPGDIISDTLLVSFNDSEYKFNFLKSPFKKCDKLIFENKVMLLRKKIKFK